MVVGWLGAGAAGWWTCWGGVGAGTGAAGAGTAGAADPGTAGV